MSCEYLHISNVNKEVENKGKDVKEVEVQTEVIISIEKKVKTKKKDKCICKKKLSYNNVHIEDHKLVCISTGAGTDETWKGN